MTGVSRRVENRGSAALGACRYGALSRVKCHSPNPRPVSCATERRLMEKLIMLTHPTLEKLHALRLLGMARAFEEQLHMDDIDALSTEERLGLLVDREMTERDARRLKYRLQKAKLRHPDACVEDIDYRHPRRLERSLMTKLATSQWLREQLNVLICGPTGIGKSWLACALANKACREGFSTFYTRVPRFLRELNRAKSPDANTLLI